MDYCLPVCCHQLVKLCNGSELEKFDNIHNFTFSDPEVEIIENYNIEPALGNIDIINNFMDINNTDTDNNTKSVTKKIPFGDFSFIPIEKRIFFDFAFICIGANINGVGIFNNPNWYFPMYTDYINLLFHFGINITNIDTYMVMTGLKNIHMAGWDTFVLIMISILYY